MRSMKQQIKRRFMKIELSGSRLRNTIEGPYGWPGKIAEFFWDEGVVEVVCDCVLGWNGKFSDRGGECGDRDVTEADGGAAL